MSTHESLKRIILAAMFAAVIAVLSQFAIPIGPIPMTMQTFAIGLVVTLLGTRTGTYAVCVYLLLGLIGLPVFAGGAAGVGVLFGPTGGYLIGFIFTALATGFIIEKTAFNYGFAILGNIVGSLVCLIFGTLWLKVQADMSFPAALAAGATPFVLPGMIKAVASGYLGFLAGRRIPFTKETYSITK